MPELAESQQGGERAPLHPLVLNPSPERIPLASQPHSKHRDINKELRAMLQQGSSPNTAAVFQNIRSNYSGTYICPWKCLTLFHAVEGYGPGE